MDNVPANVNGSATAGRHAGQPAANAPHKANKNPRKLKHLAMAAAIASIVLLAVLGGWLLYRTSMGAYIDNNKYQAVFFTNGQVYFGKLHKLSGGYFKLDDIYYLQAKADATPGNTSENPQETSTNQSSDVELIKLGQEVHGPDDEMIINKDQVLFFENLKKDGTVTQSINKFKNPQ
jgi:hypothetical protein